MSSNIAIAAIPPRLQPAHALGHITTLNANLVALAEEMGVSFLNNSEQFFLQNKEVNYGYLFDQVHSNIKGSYKLAQSIGLKSNSSDPLDIRSIYATQTKPSTWTNCTPKYVAPGLRLKTGDSTPSHEGARHDQRGTGQRGTAGAPLTSLPTPKSATRGPQSEAQGRRTEESKRSVAQNNDNDFNYPFWNKARSKVNRLLGYNHRRQQSYAQVTSSADSAPVNFCLHCGEDNHYECNRLGHKGKLCLMYSRWIVGQK